MTFAVLGDIEIVPPPVSETAALSISIPVKLFVELNWIPPAPVLFELLMFPVTTSWLLLLKLKISELPMVRPTIVAAALNVTVDPDVVITALLPEPGTVPNDQLGAEFQLPEPLSQRSLVWSGRANGRKPKACATKPFPKIIRRMAFCPRSLTGCLAGCSARGCA